MPGGPWSEPEEEEEGMPTVHRQLHAHARYQEPPQQASSFPFPRQNERLSNPPIVPPSSPAQHAIL